MNKISKKKKKEEENYVQRMDFEQKIKEYYDTGVMTNDLGVILIKIANGLGYRQSFSGYTWLDEMIGDAIIKMYKALEDKKYDPTKGYNPFSYFNMIAWRSFCSRIKKENLHNEGIKKYKETVYEQELNGFMKGGVYVKPDCGEYNCFEE